MSITVSNMKEGHTEPGSLEKLLVEGPGDSRDSVSRPRHKGSHWVGEKEGPLSTLQSQMGLRVESGWDPPQVCLKTLS